MTILDIFGAATAGLWLAFEAGQSTWSKIPELVRSLLSAGIGVLFGAWIASRVPPSDRSSQSCMPFDTHMRFAFPLLTRH